MIVLTGFHDHICRGSLLCGENASDIRDAWGRRVIQPLLVALWENTAIWFGNRGPILNSAVALLP